MKKLAKKVVFCAIALVALFFFFPSSSSAAEVNFGACMRQIDPVAKPFQAPGQTGNSPLTIDSNGVAHYAHDGGVGCSMNN